MPLDELKIKALRAEIKKKAKKSAVDELATKYPNTDINSVIAAIISDMLTVSSTPSATDVLQKVKKHFIDVNEKLNASLWTQVKLLEDIDPKEIIRELDEFLANVALLEITDANAALCKELATWAKSLYQYTARNVPEDQQKRYKANPDKFDYASDMFEDSTLYKTTLKRGLGITKYHVAVYYDKMTALLDEKIQRLEVEKQQMQRNETKPVDVKPTLISTSASTTVTTPTTVQSISSSPVRHTPIIPISAPTMIDAPIQLENEKEKVTEPVKEAQPQAIETVAATHTPTTTHAEIKPALHGYQLIEGVTVTDGDHTDIITIRVPHDEQFLAELKQFIQQYREPAPRPMAPIATLSDYLLANPKTDDIEKVRVLKTGVVQYGLTQQEENVLAAQMGEMIANIKGYANGVRYFWFTPAHASFAKEMAEKITEESSIRKKLDLFFGLFDDSISVASQTLKPQVIKSCVLAYNTVVENANIKVQMESTVLRVPHQSPKFG